MKRTCLCFSLSLVILSAFACQPPDQPLGTVGCPIINGVPDTSPEHAAVVYLQMVEDTMAYGCTGTLIGPRVVLTAGHCVWGYAPDAVTVFFGNTGMGGTARYVSTTTVHPSYNPRGIRYDIGMVQLSENAPSGVTPIPYLPHNIGIYDADIGKPLEFVGFGQTETGASGVKMTVTNNLDWICTNSGGCTLPIGAWAAPNSICQDQNPGGPCSGDSGGPALVIRSAKEYVAGITSYGDADDCQYYGCSTKVDEYEDYIRGFAGSPAGTLCSDDAECLSGNCEGGACCENMCVSLCSSCSQPGFEGQCLPMPDGTPCPDNDLCNGQEACVDGSCQRGEPPVCHDSVDCTADTCDPAKGCDFKPLAADCDDDNICTRDSCDLEQGCVHEPLQDGLECEKNKICLAGECIQNPNLDEGCGCGASSPGSSQGSGSPTGASLCLLLLLPLLLRTRSKAGNRAA